MKGDVDALRGYLAQESREEFDRNFKEMREAVMYVLMQRPSEIRIATPTITGKTAMFTVHGSQRRGEEGVGSVKMILENEGWKILEDKWTFTVK